MKRVILNKETRAKLREKYPVKHTEIKENIRNRAIEDELKDNVLSYSMSVILDRAIPKLQDGLKPVQRRILHAMRDVTTERKSARVVGEVLGKYHAHGDKSVYDAMVRLIQPFKMYVPYIIGQGNYGSLDADDAVAAYRYTQVDRDKLSDLIFYTHNQLGIKYRDNYDGTLKEPVCLAPLIPMLLVNGAIGIAVGMATYIPTHNPYEVMNAYEAYIKCELKNDNIRKYLKAPDPVVPCYVIDRDGIDRAYKTGSGKYHCMSYYHIEDDTRGKKKIVFTSVLPNRYKDNDIRSLVEKCRDQRNPLSQMVADIADESSKEGIRIVVVIKKDIKVEDAIEALIAARFCYDSFTISMRVIDEGRPMKIGIMEMMKRFHKANINTSENHLYALRAKKEQRLHILDGLEIAVTNYDTVIEIIRKAKDKQSSIEALIKKYKIDEIQATAILDTKLISLVNKGDSIKEERKVIKNEVKEINHNLKDIDGYILGLLGELRTALKPYSKRRCKIIKEIPKTPL